MLKKILILVSLMLLASSPVTVVAFENPPEGIIGVEHEARGGLTSLDTGISDLPSFLGRMQTILGWVLAFALIIGVALIIIAGIMYMTAGSDQTKTGNAIKMIISAIIGIVVAGLAWSIVAIIQSVLVAEDNSGNIQTGQRNVGESCNINIQCINSFCNNNNICEDRRGRGEPCNRHT